MTGYMGDPGEQGESKPECPETLDLFGPTFTQEQAEESIRLRDEALDLHEEKRPSDLERARSFARNHAGIHGTVNADDVRKWCADNAVEVGPWLGAVFRGKEWAQDGWTTSRDPKQHATGLRVWRHVR